MEGQESEWGTTGLDSGGTDTETNKDIKEAEIRVTAGKIKCTIHREQTGG
jgi:hypothetical protein